MTHLLSDIRYAWRGLRKAPIFTSVAALSIALGIGANTAIFTLVDQVLLRLLPVRAPQELAVVTSVGSHYGDNWGDGTGLSHPIYADLRDHNEVFSGMFARYAVPMHIGFGERTERVEGELVSGTYFPVLGVGAWLGRMLTPDDDRAPGGHPVAVISHAYWQARFASDPAIVGKTITVSSHPMTIVGVAQAGFDGVNLGNATQVYVPLMMSGLLSPIRNGIEDRRIRWVNVFGRLRPGVTPERAQAALQPFFTARMRMETEEPAFAPASAAVKAQYLQNRIEMRPAGFGRSSLRTQLERPLAILMTIVAFVLLIACANVANLLLARASVRQREVAIRLALGATRRRIVQQLVVESLLLALIGGVAGLALATWGASLLIELFRSPDRTLTVSAMPDLRILGFNVGLSLLTGLVFGLLPARQSTRPELAPTLKSTAGSVAGGGHVRLRQALVVSQVALSLLLLIGAGLFIRSLHNLMTLNPGFDTTRLLSFNVDPGLNGYDGPRGKQFAKTLLERIQTTPGVSAAGIAQQGLLDGTSWNSRMRVEGRSLDEHGPALSYNNAITPGYFPTMGMTLLAGRDFDERDERMVVPPDVPIAATVAIANEAFVKRYLDGAPAIGRHVGFGSDPGTPMPIEIVGVVSDAKYMNLRDEVQPQLFFPILAGRIVRRVIMYVRTTSEPEVMFKTLQQVVRSVDPNLPLYAVQTFDQRLQRSLTNERLVAGLSTVFGVLATLLSMIGLYGVMAYSVSRRTREIGIRMALGAVAGRISLMILREAGGLVGLGLVIGLPIAWALSRVVRSQLYEVTPNDPSTVIAATLALLGVATLAGLVPARRAARINPIKALRDE